jgi:hypothetical protein
MPEWEGATVDVPAGVYPLFLTGSTQESFGLEQCTVRDPYLMLSKEKLLAEIVFKGAISDFYVVKKEIEAYPEDEILVCLDDDEIYGQNFFMCITVGEKDRVVAEEAEKKAAMGPEPGEGGGSEDEDEFVEEPYVPPVSKPWESLGSEVEVCAVTCPCLYRALHPCPCPADASHASPRPHATLTVLRRGRLRWRPSRRLASASSSPSRARGATLEATTSSRTATRRRTRTSSRTTAGRTRTRTSS